jgi:hypothetical protein
MRCGKAYHLFRMQPARPSEQLLAYVRIQCCISFHGLSRDKSVNHFIVALICLLAADQGVGFFISVLYIYMASTDKLKQA